MKRQGGWIAIVVVLVTNALVLSGVSISRAGGPEARVDSPSRSFGWFRWGRKTAA